MSRAEKKNRGQISPRAAVGLVVALTVGVIVTSFILPIGVDQLVSDQNTTLDQTQGETDQVDTNLNSTLDNVDNFNNNNINVTLENTASGTTASLTNISEGNTQTATLDGDDVDVTNDNVTSDTEATVTYSYPREFGWSSGAQSLWNILDVIIVLAVFLVMIAIALSASNRV